MGTVSMERTWQREVVGLRKAFVWTKDLCDPQAFCPLTEFPPDRLQLADGDYHCSGPSLHWVHREGGDWVLEADQGFWDSFFPWGYQGDSLSLSTLRYILGAPFGLV